MMSTTLFQEWLQIWRRRCCPPEDVLHGRTSRALQAHLRNCPWCDMDRRAGATGWRPPPLPPGDGSAQPGHLYSLTHELAGWGPKNRFYNPPLVVVTAVSGPLVTVLQSCSVTAFAGEDDLPFTVGLSGFAEPWNRYTLYRRDLHHCYGSVFAEPAVLADPSAFPSGPQLEAGSLLWFFRQLEIESGYFFAAQALERFYAAQPAGPSAEETIISLPGAELRDRLCHLGARLPEEISGHDAAIDLIFQAEPDDNLLPVAAAENEQSGYALLFRVEQGGIVDMRVLGVEFSTWRRDGRLLFVSGNFLSPPAPETEAVFRLHAGAARYDPVPGEYGIDGAFFWALFDVGENDVDDGECLIRLFDRT